MARIGRGNADEAWGPWITHDGWGCPVRSGTVVEVACEDRFGQVMREVSTVSGDPYSSWDWSHFPALKKIIRYRERKSRSFEMLQTILQTLTVPTTERAG